MTFDFLQRTTKPRHRLSKGLIARSRRKCENTSQRTIRVDILQKLVKSYNHSRHRSIGMRPVDVNKSNENIVWQTLYGKESSKTLHNCAVYRRISNGMYVYTDIVDAQFVGDVKVPLLRIVNVEREYGNTVHASFRNFQYVPVKVNPFETIEVNIKNDQNENISLEFGKSIATLHFRQKRSDNNNNNYIYPGYPHHLRVFQWGPASKLQLFTILIVN